MSFSVAFLVYGFCLRFFGASGTKSKIAQWTLTPLVVILWNLLVITRNDISRAILGALPMVALAAFVIYYKIKHGQNGAPEPHEFIEKRTSAKSLKHKEKSANGKKQSGRSGKRTNKGQPCKGKAVKQEHACFTAFLLANDEDAQGITNKGHRQKGQEGPEGKRYRPK